MLWLIIWTLIAVATSWVAEQKGRSGVGWMLAGLLLGPLALLVAVLLGRDEQALIARRLARGELRRCPYCQEPIQRDAIKCRWCGSKVLPIAQQPTWFDRAMLWLDGPDV